MRSEDVQKQVILLPVSAHALNASSVCVEEEEARVCKSHENYGHCDHQCLHTISSENNQPL